MKRVYFSACILLIVSIASYSQSSSQIQYCQIAASEGPSNDPIVERFLFGFSHQDYADSLFKAFKFEYGAKRKRQVLITDALNYLGSLGWELQSVYLVPASNKNVFTDYYYVMKKK